jgi:endonuclease/exonuclease/phosphatase family metal-dependent hydrolase
MLRSPVLLLSLFAFSTGCDKPQEETKQPTAEELAAQKAAEEKAAAEKVAAEKAAAEKAAEEAYRNRDYFTAATFNLAWAHDDLGGGPKKATLNQAQKGEDWTWKVEAIAKIIAEHKPDIIALHELGGSDELHDIVVEISKAGGPEYDYAHEPSVDDRNGHHSAIISRFTVSNARRYDIYLKRHVLADVELLNGDTITVAAIHPPEGPRGSAKKGRIKQVQAFLRKLKKKRADRPYLVLASMGSNITPTDEGYKKSAAGLLAGANNNKSGDDCDDSAEVGSVVATTTDEKVADRIFSCGLSMRDGATVGEEQIVRGFTDKWDVPWSTVPVDKDPTRDVSDHLMVVVEIELPKKPAKEEAADGEKADAE